MKKSEKLTLAILVAASIATFLIVQLGKVVPENTSGSSSSAPSSEPATPSVIPAGDSFVFNSEAPQNERVNEQGVSYKFNLGWQGTMSMKVMQAKAYPTASSLDDTVPDVVANEMCSHGNDDRRGLLLITLDIENINATPTSSDSENKPAFDASIFGVFNQTGTLEEVAYFSGSGQVEQNHDFLRFQLSPGEEKTYTIGYWYGSFDGTDVTTVPAALDVGFDGQRHSYEMELGTVVVEKEQQ